MTLSPLSLVALALIVAGVALAWMRRLPATGVLAVTCGLVHLLREFPSNGDLLVLELGLDTGALQSGEPIALLQVFTAAFVHGDFFHLFGNLIILLALGLPFEERVGPRVITAIYLATGALAALTQVATTLGQSYPLVGASGAVFGILGAFAGAYPNLVTPLPLPLFFIMVFVRMRVWVAAVVMGSAQFLYLSLFSSMTRVAYAAHIGGLVFGILLGVGLRRSIPNQTPQPVDLRLLEPFAPDPATKDALARMDANSDEPAVFQAWLDRFFRSARCPTCQHRVMPHHRGEVVCTQGHRFDVRAKRAPAAQAR